jgi:hypothetical protein
MREREREREKGEEGGERREREELYKGVSQSTFYEVSRVTDRAYHEHKERMFRGVDKTSDSKHDRERARERERERERTGESARSYSGERCLS